MITTVNERITAARKWTEYRVEMAAKTILVSDPAKNALIEMTMTQQISDYLAQIDPQALKQCQLALTDKSWEDFVVPDKLQQAWKEYCQIQKQGKIQEKQGKILWQESKLKCKDATEIAISRHNYAKASLLCCKADQMRHEAEIQWLKTLMEVYGDKVVVAYDFNDCIVNNNNRFVYPKKESKS